MARDRLELFRVDHCKLFWLVVRAGGGAKARLAAVVGVHRPVIRRPGRESELPTTFWAFAPILIPLTLIAAQSTATMMLLRGYIVDEANLNLGWPVVALSIRVLIAYRNTKRDQASARTGQWIENALRTSAMIIMVVGLGGALSQILRQTPAVDAIARAMQSTGLPAIFLPFALGVVGNMITGSTTVGAITAASIVSPMMATLGLSPEATMRRTTTGVTSGFSAPRDGARLDRDR